MSRQDQTNTIPHIMWHFGRVESKRHREVGSENTQGRHHHPQVRKFIFSGVRVKSLNRHTRYPHTDSPHRRVRDVLLVSFCPEGFVGIGVSIGTDAFAQNFVSKTCRTIKVCFALSEWTTLIVYKWLLKLFNSIRWRRKIGRYSRRLYTLSAPQVLPGHSTPIY
jgi:hypothetical protein